MTIEVHRFLGSAAVLLRTSDAPDFPMVVVDVRPGRVATFDGDRHRHSMWVSSTAHRTSVPAATPAELEATAVEALPATGPKIVRFGDRRTASRLLPGARVDAIERRLLALAVETDATLVTWTTGGRRPGDRRRYDLVLDRPAPPSSRRCGRASRSGPPGARPGHR